VRTCYICNKLVSVCWREAGKEYCEDCASLRPSYMKPNTGRAVVNSDEWANGVYEHIAWDPITITGGKKELKAVCEKHGVMARALLKPCSQGKGYEMR